MKRFSKRRGPIDWDEDDEIIVYCQYMDSWTKEDNMKVDKRNIVKDILKRLKNDELSRVFLEIFEDIYKKQDDFMCGLVPLLWLFGHRKDNVSIVPPASKKTLEKWENLETYEIPPYAIDRHTSKGKNSGKDKYDFVSEGAKIDTSIESDDFCTMLMNFYEETRVVQEIQNEMAESGLTVFRKSYIRSAVSKETAKIVVAVFSESSECGGGSPGETLVKETESYEFIVRCQLVCSAHRTDVYLAKGFREWDNKVGLAIVKGPYKNTDMLDLLDETVDWCNENNINIPKSSKVLMCPDRWPEGTPIGMRNNITNRNIIPRPFLISQFVGDRHNINVIERTTNNWAEPVEVMGSSLHSDGGVSIIRDWKGLSDNTKFNYILALMAKYILGVGDWADRNFLFNDDDSVYLIDIDVAVRQESINFENELKAKKYAFVMDFLEEDRFDAYLKIVSNWTYFDNESKARLKRLIKKLKKQRLP
jgi:hypothetical protein